MRSLVLALCLLLVVVIVLLSSAPTPASAYKIVASRNTRAKSGPITSDNCAKGKTVVTCWERKFDPCQLPKEVQAACKRKDGRLAYDEIWDARRALGYDCGKKQFRYKGNSWEQICAKVATKSTIEGIYAAANCTAVKPGMRRGRINFNREIVDVIRRNKHRRTRMMAEGAAAPAAAASKKTEKAAEPKKTEKTAAAAPKEAKKVEKAAAAEPKVAKQAKKVEKPAENPAETKTEENGEERTVERGKMGKKV
ncbi:hypothetical protein HDU96_005061 [Phlyctochytrium bullatum]|nr:hypothetical protein HDU96_005061 [Phlyctochytrium bullatum]